MTAYTSTTEGEPKKLDELNEASDLGGSHWAKQDTGGPVSGGRGK